MDNTTIVSSGSLDVPGVLLTAGPGLPVLWVPRDEWGADTRLDRIGPGVSLGKRDLLVIHHTASVDTSDDTPNIWEDWAEIRRHIQRLQKARPDLSPPGMDPDVPYNAVAYLCPQSVVLCEGRGWGRRGAHIKGMNTRSLGIALAGNFMTWDRGGEQGVHVWPGLGDYLQAIIGYVHGLRPLGLDVDSMGVMGHRDMGATDCPGDALYDALVAVSS